MSKKTKSRSWSVDQGLAAQYAVQAGIDQDLAAAAGEAAWDVLKSLRRAVDESDAKRRMKRVAKVQRLLSQSGLRPHADLRKMIQDRLHSLVGAEGPSVNPETGLQEFVSQSVNSVPPRPTRKPLDTQNFYWREKWANEQPGEAFAQNAWEAFQADLSNTPEGHARRNAQLQVFKEKWLPTNQQLSQLPTSIEQNRDFLRHQGVNPDAAGDAPIVDPELLRKTNEKMYTGDASRSSGIPGFDALKFPDVTYSNFYNPNDQTMRMKVRETFNDDPMYPVYDSMRREQDQSALMQDNRRWTREYWDKVMTSGFGDKYIAKP